MKPESEPPAIITIDGPAGSGKSTIGELLARRVGYLYFDTGVMYRAVTLAALQQGQDYRNGARMEDLARQIQIDVQPPGIQDGRQYTVLVDGNDVTWDIREPEVDQTVSIVSRHPGVRVELIRQQRIIGHRGKVVMVGRDIGTIVIPDAPLKIYLHTSLRERARRRHAELSAKGTNTLLEQVQADIARRDELDDHVMQPASDALVLDTETCAPHECVDWIISQFQTTRNLE
jgi:CMP/dCMP kinase